MACVLTQTEELLLKRQKLLEKKIAQETERAKEFTRASNKRGELSSESITQGWGSMLHLDLTPEQHSICNHRISRGLVHCSKNEVMRAST